MSIYSILVSVEKLFIQHGKMGGLDRFGPPLAGLAMTKEQILAVHNDGGAMGMRGRPKRPRNIRNEPCISQFSPRGRIGRPGYVNLSLDEYEALRLADFIGLSQKEAANSMEISQQTYSRVLKGARKALVEGIVLGRIIKIASSA